MTRHFIASLALLVSASGLASAADASAAAADSGTGSNGEVRAIFGSLPGIKSGVPGVDRRVSEGGQLLYLYQVPAPGPAHVLVGGGLFDDSRRGEDGNDNQVRYEAQGVVLTGGADMYITKPIKLEARVDLKAGIGRAIGTENLSEGSYQVIGSGEAYYAASFELGGYWIFPNRIDVGGEIGIDTFRGKSDLPNQALELRGNGGFFRGGVGYSF